MKDAYEKRIAELESNRALSFEKEFNAEDNSAKDQNMMFLYLMHGKIRKTL